MTEDHRPEEPVTLWKATRPDGTDFYTGEVDYGAALASGEPLPELSGGEFPGGGWYHASTVPTECVGMTWPCRLFHVESVGDIHTDSAHPHKVGCRTLRVLAEVDAHVALGPQGPQVAALIDRAGALTADEARHLDAARYAAWYAARAAARAAAWAAAWDAARAAAWAAAGDAAWDAAWDTARAAAWDTARAAARALVVRDLTGHHPGWNQGEYDLLTGPWRSAIGPIHPDDDDWRRGA